MCSTAKCYIIKFANEGTSMVYKGKGTFVDHGTSLNIPKAVKIQMKQCLITMLSNLASFAIYLKDWGGFG